LFMISQNMNFGFWKKNLVQIIADYVYFHVTYHTYIWSHAGWHRSILNMVHFQLLNHVLIANFQVQLGAKLVEGKKVQKNWLSVSKIRKFFCQYSHFFKKILEVEIWFLMMILMAKQLIWTVFTCILILNKNTPNRP
jgi:hypothetical protein